MPDAIIFDLDDTIILFETPDQTLLQNAITRFIGELDGPDIPTVIQAILDVAEKYWSDPARHRAGRLDLVKARREICRMAFSSLGRTDFALADKIADGYGEHRDNKGVLSSGAIDLLKNLRQRDIRLAMITNGASDMQRAKIKQFGLEPYFDNILIEGEFECGKPDERVFYHTLEKLKVKPADAWMVGDDIRYDIAPCRALGIFSVWVNGNSDTAHLAESVCPDKVIKSISEIPDLL